MSHEIEIHDKVVLGSNKPAWHGLGQVFPGLLSALRVYAEGVGHRDILEVPVVLNGLTLEGQKGLVGVTASGAQVPLSVVGDNYGVFKSSTMYKLLDEVYEGRAVVETAGTLRNGKREWCLAKAGDWDVTSGDKVLSYDLWLNRHDGSGCFELHRTNVRVVCSNTWKLAVGSGRARVFGVRHTVNIEAGVREAIGLLRRVNDAEATERAKARTMAMTPMSFDEAYKTFEKVLGISDSAKASTRANNQLNDLMHLFKYGTGNAGRSYWDAFNAVTEFIDHSRSNRVSNGRSQQEVRFESVLMGSGDSMKARAFDLLAPSI